jgi:hypothetical protein
METPEPAEPGGATRRRGYQTLQPVSWRKKPLNSDANCNTPTTLNRFCFSPRGRLAISEIRWKAATVKRKSDPPLCDGSSPV